MVYAYPFYMHRWFRNVDYGLVFCTSFEKNLSSKAHTIDHQILFFSLGRDDSNPGPDEPGPGASRAKGLLCSSPSEAHEMQEGQLAQFPGLQAWEAWLGLLWTSGVSAPNIHACTRGLLNTSDFGVYYRYMTISFASVLGSDPDLLLSDVFLYSVSLPRFFIIRIDHCHFNYASLFYKIEIFVIKKNI